MNNDFKKLERAVPARLSEAERASLRSEFHTYMDAHPLRTAVPSSRSFLFAHSTAYAFAALLLVGVPVSFAAERSLPNDTLYFVKTNILEKAVLGVASLSEESRAKAHVSLADRRLSEAEELIASDEDTPETLTYLATEVKENVATLRQIVEASAPADDEVREAGAELSVRLGAHEAILDLIADEPTDVDTFADEVSEAREDTDETVEAAEDRAENSGDATTRLVEAEEDAQESITELAALLENAVLVPGSFEEQASSLLTHARFLANEAQHAEGTDNATELMQQTEEVARKGIIVLNASERLPDDSDLK